MLICSQIAKNPKQISPDHNTQNYIIDLIYKKFGTSVELKWIILNICIIKWSEIDNQIESIANLSTDCAYVYKIIIIKFELIIF